MTKRIRYSLNRDDALSDYVFDFLFWNIGISSEKTGSGDADIIYGVDQSNVSELRPRLYIPYDPTCIIRPESEMGQGQSGRDDPQIDFDIISAIGALLTDAPNHNRPRSAYDKHGRLRAHASFQAEAGILQNPIVNHYVDYFRNVLQKRFGFRARELWPHGKCAAIALSHDVDAPDKYAILRGPMFFKNENHKEYILSQAKRSRALFQRFLDRSRDDFWLFDNIIDAESRLGLSSTFFFASVNMFSRYASSCDVAYDISTPRFRDTFSKLCERNFEIGLHASYNAFKKSGRLSAEKSLLEDRTECNITGVRRHYWRLGENAQNALKEDETTGFTYDSSLAFNDDPGFRRSVALPYHVWSESEKRALRTWQAPMFLMDGNLFYHSDDVSTAVGKALHLVSTIKDARGMGVIDWHVRSSFPSNQNFRHWGEAYLNIIQSLACDSELWVTNVGEIISWLDKRDREISEN